MNQSLVAKMREIPFQNFTQEVFDQLCLICQKAKDESKEGLQEIKNYINQLKEVPQLPMPSNESVNLLQPEINFTIDEKAFEKMLETGHEPSYLNSDLEKDATKLNEIKEKQLELKKGEEDDVAILENTAKGFEVIGQVEEKIREIEEVEKKKLNFLNKSLEEDESSQQLPKELKIENRHQSFEEIAKTPIPFFHQFEESKSVMNESNGVELQPIKTTSPGKRTSQE